MVFRNPGPDSTGRGLLVSMAILPGPVSIGSVRFDYHTLVYSTSAIVLGYQSLLLYVFAKLVAVETGLHPLRTRFWILEDRGTLERFVVIGAALSLAGVVLGIIAAGKWSLSGFGDIHPTMTIRLVICSALFMLLGAQTVLAGFCWSREFASGAENSARRVVSWIRGRLNTGHERVFVQRSNHPKSENLNV